MDAALRVFLIVSGDMGGSRVEFFWPPTTNNNKQMNEMNNRKVSSSVTDCKNNGLTASESLKSFDEMATTSSTSLISQSSSSSTSLNKLSKSQSHPISLVLDKDLDKDWSFNTIEQDCRIYGIPLSDFGELLFPPHRYHHKIFELKIDNILYISYPFCWPENQCRTKKLNGFNIVFAINLKLHFNKLTKQNKKMWFDIIIKYVRIVQHEERRIGYLSEQLDKLSKITHSVLTQRKQKKNKRKLSINDENHENDEKEQHKIDKTMDIIKMDDNVISNILTEMCSNCPIANDMKRIQEILSINDEIKLLINGWVELHCSLKPPEENIIIRPYHTLLLLPQQQQQTNNNKKKEEEKKEREDNNDNDDYMNDINSLRCIRKDAYDLLQKIPISGSQSLRLMISTANICSSFGDMASLTNIPLPTLFHFALHLKYWGKALIIDTINKSSEFAIHPNANFVLIHKDSIYQKQFSEAFPHRKSLIEELQRFNHPEILWKMLVLDKKYIESDDISDEYQKQDFIFLIAWLLQRKLLIRMHRYINYIGQVGQIPNIQNIDNKLFVLFEKVKPYFNGQNHFLEIMFQTGLSSKKLQLIIDEFNDQLISCYHPQDY